jgi:hypothetical protein
MADHNSSHVFDMWARAAQEPAHVARGDVKWVRYQQSKLA